MSRSYPTRRTPGAVEPVPIAELWKLLSFTIDEGSPVPATTHFLGRGVPGSAYGEWPALCVLVLANVDELRLWADALGAAVDESEDVEPAHGEAYTARRAHVVLEGWRIALVVTDSTGDERDETEHVMDGVAEMFADDAELTA